MAKKIKMQVFSVQHVLVEGSLSIVATVTDHPRVVQKWINNVSNSLQKVGMNDNPQVYGIATVFEGRVFNPNL